MQPIKSTKFMRKPNPNHSRTTLLVCLVNLLLEPLKNSLAVQLLSVCDELVLRRPFLLRENNTLDELEPAQATLFADAQ